MSDTSSASEPSAELLLAQANTAFAEERWVDSATLSLRALKISSESLQKGQIYLALARPRWHLGAIPACCRSAIHAEGLARLVGNEALMIDAGTLVAFSLTEIGLASSPWTLRCRRWKRHDGRGSTTGSRWRIPAPPWSTLASAI